MIQDNPLEPRPVKKVYSTLSGWCGLCGVKKESQKKFQANTKDSNSYYWGGFRVEGVTPVQNHFL